MTTPRLREQNDLSSVFLVERYLPPATTQTLAASITRASELCALSGPPGSASEVRYLHAAYLPTEDTCFCLFRAATADAVRALNDEADFALDRLTAAILLYPTQPAPGESRRDRHSP